MQWQFAMVLCMNLNLKQNNSIYFCSLNAVIKNRPIKPRFIKTAIAFQAGSEVGGLKKVNTGVFQITVPNSTRVSSWGSYDTSTINKDITAVMGVTFEVN